MKKLLITLLTIGSLALLAQQATTSSDISFTANFTGTPNKWDREAAIWWIDRHNAGLDEQDTPLPKATGPEIKASYLTIIGSWITTRHQTKVNQLITQASVVVTPSERGSILDALDTKLKAGTSVADLLTAINGAP